MNRANRQHKSIAYFRFHLSGLLIIAIWLVGCGGAPMASTPYTVPAAATAVPPQTPNEVTVAAARTLEKSSSTPVAIPTLPRELATLCWVGYSPTNYDPNKGIEPSDASIRQDLQVLRAAGFSGLVTYGATGALGGTVPRLAEESGFQGFLMGIWDPNSPVERDQALAAAKLRITLGYVVGNEGLGKRYDLATLQSAMAQLRRATGKSVTTTEEIGDYADPIVLALGDWVFPNVHPFFAGILDPRAAATWTENNFIDLQKRANRLVMFKEVGLPTDGDPRGRLDETVQAEYYRRLKEIQVPFVYFESFDQPWKNDPSVEPYWGLFKADRRPKQVVQYVCGKTSPAPTAVPVPQQTLAPTITGGTQVFNVYTDAQASDNRFTPSGYMGDTGDIAINVVWSENPHSGSSTIKITYMAQGKGPNECPYAPPCKWAGVYWQTPPNNWGTIPNVGINLTGFRRLTFWARSDNPVRVEFKVGGITGKYSDSIQPARSSGIVILSPEWRQYEITLADADLSYVIGGFTWAANWADNQIGKDNPAPLIFYLDDIRFER